MPAMSVLATTGLQVLTGKKRVGLSMISFGVVTLNRALMRNFAGEMVRFYGASLVPGKIGGDIGAAPGTVTGLDLKGLRVAVEGGELLVSKVRTASAGKVDAAAWASAANVKPGERFGKFSK